LESILTKCENNAVEELMSNRLKNKESIESKHESLALLNQKFESVTDRVKGIEKKLDALIDHNKQRARKTELTAALTDNVRALVSENSAMNLLAKMSSEPRGSISGFTPRNATASNNTTKINTDEVVSAVNNQNTSGTSIDINQDPKNIFINVQPLHAWEYDGTPDPDIFLE
jgi:hypothetical protein